MTELPRQAILKKERGPVSKQFHSMSMSEEENPLKNAEIMISPK